MFKTIKKTDQINIINWNANGILNKLSEFKDFLTTYDPDIAVITETHLNNSNNLNVANYTTYRCDRPYRGGGVAILAKNSLSHFELNKDHSDGTEQIAIILNYNNKNLQIVGIYNKPGHIITDQQVNNIFKIGYETIVAGDFNSKHVIWGCQRTNIAGRNLKKQINRLALTVIAPLEATYFPNINGRSPDLLDFAITNSRTPMSASTLNELGSDHHPVIISVGISVNHEIKQINSTNWTLYQNILLMKHIKRTNQDNTNENARMPPDSPHLNFIGNSYPDPSHSPNLNTTAEIDKAIEEIHNNIISAVDDATLQRPYYPNFLKLPPEIKFLIRQRNWCRKKFRKTNDPTYKSETKNLNKQIHKLCKQHKNNKWNEKMESLAVNDNSIWKMAKVFKTNKKVNRPLKTKNGYACTDQDKAEVFADSLEDQFSLNTEYDKENHRRVMQRVNDFYLNTNDSTNIEHTDLEEVLAIIKNLKINKAPGKDSIKNKMVKLLPLTYVQQLVHIYNACLDLQYFPTAWKTASIILILKQNKDPANPTSYRPISLLPTMGKILERIIYNRIKPLLTCLPNEQYGFREKLDTTKQLLRILDYIGRGLHLKQSTALLMLDISKAFDRVWHEGIIYKLIELSFPSPIIKIIHNYLKNRNYHIKLNNTNSTLRSIRAGVPQGSILGPILYILYTHDFPVDKEDYNSLTAFYADDTGILVKSKNPNHAIKRLQEKIHVMEDWFYDWKFEVNASKSQLLLIQKSKRKIKENNQLILFNKIIPTVTKATYLGLTINKNLTWTDHVKNIKNKANAAVNKLHILLNQQKLSIKLKKLLYTSMIRPILTYASPAWCNVTQNQLSKLIKTQNKILRRITSARWFQRNSDIHKDLKIDRFDHFFHKVNRNFFEKAKNCNEANFNEIFQFINLNEDIHLRAIAHYHNSDASYANYQNF